MMQHIYQEGPIACGIADPVSFKEYDGGIYEDKDNHTSVSHVISIVGYGVENGTKYWFGRNSWGEHWGEEGFFKIVRGIDNLSIESHCSFGNPVDTWTDEVKHLTTDEERNDPRNDFNNSDYLPKGDIETETTMHDLHNLWEGDQETNVPEDILNYDDSKLPKSIDWRNYNGTNYVSWMKNQHIPTYCGSCWSQGTTSAIADRFNIMNWLRNGNISMPQVSISAQSLVNCKGGGTCNGGMPLAVYRFAKNHGLAHAS